VKIKNLANAVLKEEKFTEYLLSPDHPVGRFKEAYFRRFGFTRSHWQVLRDALLEHAVLHEIFSEKATPHGVLYLVEGPLRTPYA
jgi:hypothetical protein